MVNYLVSLGIVLALFISTYGWGFFIVRWAYENRRQPAALSAAAGCAVYILVGGILNATHTVGPTAINVLGIGGICLALLSAFPSIRQTPKVKLADAELGSWLMLILTGYYAVTLVPTPLFNVGDDFHTYLVYPFRMLQTGTASAGAGDLLGSGTLSAQAFLQSILLLRLPIVFVDAFDLLFCFLVSGLLIDGIGRRTGLDWRYRLVPLFAFVVISPQYVNISSLYSGSMMILGLVFSSVLAVESKPDGVRQIAVRMLPMALFAAALAVLKLTFLVFLIVYGLMFVLSLRLLGWRTKHVLMAGTILMVLATTLASPWLYVLVGSYTDVIVRYFNHYFNAVASNDISASAPAITSSRTDRGPLVFFSTSRLFWGGSFVGYALMLITIGATSVILAFRSIGKVGENRNPVIVVGMTAFVAVIANMIFLSYQVSPQTAIRYSTPSLIAIFPLTVALLGASMSWAISSGRVLQLPIFGGILLTAQFLVIGQFLDAFAVNLVKSYKQHSIIAYPVINEDIAFSFMSLTGAARNEVRKAQSAVPEGEPLFAWLGLPFHLDFARNRVVALDTLGLGTLARRIDLDEGAQGFENYLRTEGIRYLMWTRKSFNVRNRQSLRRDLATTRRAAAQRALTLMDAIERLMNDRTKLFDNGEIVVIDIGNSR